jgi:7,8-dihydroneopterin aldolase/epimerase/oxygenase
VTDRIHVTGIEVWGRHGVLTDERAKAQRFLIDLSVMFDSAPAAASDDLNDTVDYGILAERVHAVVESESYRLIETVAGRVADTVLADPRVSSVRVTVHKPQAPIAVPFEDVFLTIDRSR